jgi:hypothetical protein
MQILKDDLIYIAGFLDGDGSIIAQLVKRDDYKNGYQIRLSIQFTQLTKRRIYLEKLKDLIGVGYIRDRSFSPKRGVETSPVSDYVITETKQVYLFLKMITPFLRIKKKQADLVITIIEQLPLAKDPHKFYELCQKVDQVAAFNDSKSRLITADVVYAKLFLGLTPRISL